MEAPGVEDDFRRGQERTGGDNAAYLHVVGGDVDGHNRPARDSDCSTVANALRAALKAWIEHPDPRALRMALLVVLLELDRAGAPRSVADRGQGGDANSTDVAVKDRSENHPPEFPDG